MDSAVPPSREIPVAFAASLRSWWHVGEKESAFSEERLLRRLPFYRSSSNSNTTPSGPVVATSSRVQLSTPNRYLNTFSITSTSPSPTAPPPAVVLHGYGAGLGFFFHNFPPLADWAARRGTSVFALDWLGMGRSARVPFTIKAKKSDVDGRVAEAESFFVDSLEDWRAKKGLERMTLIGHSLGAYFSVAYALKYPDRVHKLILLSPAGVPHGPNYEEPSRELTDAGPSASAHQGTMSPQREKSSYHRATGGRVNNLRDEQKENKEKESRTRRLFTYLWEEGWSPFQLVRSTVFWSPMLIGKYSSRRFSVLTPEETRDMHDYIMNITLAKGSGEYCISHILEPGAHARKPIVDRITALPKDMHITFVYGDHDWMDPIGGQESVKRLKRAGNHNGRMYIVKNSGHHVYLDNKDDVNDLLVTELER